MLSMKGVVFMQRFGIVRDTVVVQRELYWVFEGCNNNEYILMIITFCVVFCGAGGKPMFLVSTTKHARPWDSHTWELSAPTDQPVL